MGFVGKLEEIRARARQQIEDGAVTKDYSLDHNQVIRVLNSDAGQSVKPAAAVKHHVKRAGRG